MSSDVSACKRLETDGTTGTTVLNENAPRAMLGINEVNEMTRDIDIVSYNAEEKIFNDKHLAVAVEKPLEIFVNKKPYSVTMRSPDAEGDSQLAIGFCFTEGIFDDYMRDIDEVCKCPHKPPGARVVLFLKGEAKELFLKNYASRLTYTAQTSCGLCGKSEIDEIFAPLSNISGNTVIRPQVLYDVLSIFESNQKGYHNTKTTHATAIFSQETKLLSMCEDVGRHNAMDKAIGSVLLKGKKRHAKIMLTSSRISFELVQKAVRCGVEFLLGVSAATTQAVELSRMYGLTLVGLLRPNGFTIYSNPQRIERN